MGSKDDLLITIQRWCVDERKKSGGSEGENQQRSLLDLRYGFCKGSTIARQALRISRDIIFIHFANIDGRGEFRRDPSDVTTALRFINAADVLIMCNVSESNPEETHWDLSARVDGKAGRVDFVSKSLPEIKAAMKASREKGEIAKETLNSIVVGRNGRH